MSAISDLEKGYRLFRAGLSEPQTEHYRRLGNGQNPDVMIISCADSRVEPAAIFSLSPGQAFTIRNVANLVPPCHEAYRFHAESAALEFAVTVLKIHHIVIMGHGGCGGIAASLAAKQNQSAGRCIDAHIQLLDGVRDRVCACYPATDVQTVLEHEAIGASIDNLMTFPFVAERVQTGCLALHGAWFSIDTATLHWRNRETGIFAPHP